MTKNNKIAVYALVALFIFGLAAYTAHYLKKAPEKEAKQALLVESAQTAEAAAQNEEDKGESFDKPHSVQTDDGLGIRAVGNPNAPVRIVEYASLTCSHCASFHLNTLPDLEKRYVENGDLYIQFEEFPLNAPALDASLLARCLPAERYYGFVDLLFKTQESWMMRPDYRIALIQNAKLAGLSEEKANECLESKKMREALAGRIQAVSQKHQITSTPTFIVNDGEEIIRGAQPLYEFERVFRKVSDNKVATIKKEKEEE